MTVRKDRFNWNAIPGESGFAYLNHNGVRVAHIVRNNGSWSWFVTDPKLCAAGHASGVTDAKRQARTAYDKQRATTG